MTLGSIDKDGEMWTSWNTNRHHEVYARWGWCIERDMACSKSMYQLNNGSRNLGEYSWIFLNTWTNYYLPYTLSLTSPLCAAFRIVKVTGLYVRWCTRIWKRPNRYWLVSELVRSLWQSPAASEHWSFRESVEAQTMALKGHLLDLEQWG
jgi:hypothetical protein